MSPGTNSWQAVTPDEWLQVLSILGPDLHPYQTPDWHGLLRGGGVQLSYWAEYSLDSGQPIHGFHGSLQGWGPCQRLVLPLLTPYLGWVRDPKKDIQSSRMELPLSIDGVASPPLWHQPLPVEKPCLPLRNTCYLDLSRGYATFQAGLAAHARRHLKKVHRQSAWTLETIQPADFPAVHAYPILKQVWIRRGLRCPVSPILFSSLWEGQASTGFRRWWVARRLGKAQALLMTIEHGKTLAYAVAACLPEALADGVATALLVRSAEDAICRGLSRYDLVGANTPAITRFKMGMGAILIAYPVTHQLRRPFSWLLPAWRKLRNPISLEIS